MGGRVKIRRGDYNPTSDAVWLASAIIPPVSAQTGATNTPIQGRGELSVLDVGCGTGAVSLCMLAHNPNLQITGLDISEQMLSECAENAKLNNREIELIHGDITTWRTARTFDLVITNPPYFVGSAAKHNAHHNADIYEWTRKSIARVKPRGYFATIVDTGVADKVIAALYDAKAGNIEIIPLFGKHQTPNIKYQTAERAIIRARAGVLGPTKIHCGISMQDSRILRDGLTIDQIFTTL